MLQYLGSVEALKTYLLGFGQWTPLVYFVLQLLQVVIAPIPGGATTLIGGALFGGFWGFILSGTAVLIGSCGAFFIAKRLGRPFVLKFSKNSPWISKFEHIQDDKIDIILFLIFIFPGFPDDLMCFVAGLTKINFNTFVILCAVGRLPGLLLTCLMGAGIMSDNPVKLGIILAVYAVFVLVFVLTRKRLEAYINAHHNTNNHKENTNENTD